MITRRTFFRNSALALFGFSVLPPATAYERIWKAERRVVGPAFAVPMNAWFYPGPNFSNPASRFQLWLMGDKLMYQEKDGGEWIDSFVKYTKDGIPMHEVHEEVHPFVRPTNMFGTTGMKSEWRPNDRSILDRMEPCS